ncbi:MAG: sigma-70 family RNA polymerase sigma factor [Ignavibacteria bacterium]|nr:sigma-70 family RNA polymerase sigma factor [Ignavibacteria bacterium]
MITPENPGRHNLKQIVLDYSRRLTSFISRRVDNDEEVRDILQDVWYQLSNAVDTGPIEQIGSWLYRVTSNRIIDRYRRKKPESLEDMAYEDEEGELIFPESLFAVTDTPETELERQELKEQIFVAISLLPGKQRDVFIKNEIEGLTLQEIADKTGESIKTIISRKRYAVQQLRELLENLSDEE